MSGFRFLSFLIFGNFQTEYIIDLNNHSYPEILGGSALYSAGGLSCWNDRIAVIGHTHSRHQSKLAKIHDKFQVDFSGIKYHDNQPDDRIFLGCSTLQEIVQENPVAYYAGKNLPFPRSLIGYSKNNKTGSSTGRARFLPEDIPQHYREATMSLICPFDLITQLQLTSMLLRTATKTIVMQSSPQYMKMEIFETLPVLMKDLTAFATTTVQLNNLFRNRTTDIWEMAEYLCDLGCSYLIAADDHFGFYLYDRTSRHRYRTPTYPVFLVDPNGMLDSFCGGFLAGMKNSFDPIEALIHGTVSASFTGEGSGPFFGVEALSELHHSRLKYARELVKRV